MTIYNQIASNKLKTFLMMGVFILLFLGVSFVLGRALGYGSSFVGVMLIISGIMSFVSYYYSDKIVLSMSGAVEAKRDQHRALFNSVENLSIAQIKEVVRHTLDLLAQEDPVDVMILLRKRLQALLDA